MSPPNIATASAPPRIPGAGSSLPGLAQLIAAELAPRVIAIDLKGEYPENFLRKLGDLGGFAGHVSPRYGGSGAGMGQTLRVMEEVGKECLSTAFLVWCQSTCAWYLENTGNEALRARVLPAVAAGSELGGTGLSNLMKSCAGIEPVRLEARRVGGGYVVNGTLPWVSNLGPDHWFAVGAAIAGGSGLLVAMARGGMEGLTVNQVAHFAALEGTRTLACRFHEVFVPDSQVLAHPSEFEGYIQRIKPGFILSQMGMALGLVSACVELMKQANRTTAHVNRFLNDQPEEIVPALARARATTYTLAEQVDAGRGDACLREILELRADGAELALKAAQAALLHLGAKGYLIRNPAQRRLREAYFIAIVTPALKHLRKELHDLDAACGCRP